MGRRSAARAQREANRIARQQLSFSKKQAEDAKKEREEQKAILEAEKAQYEAIEFENVYEEAEVNTAAAEFAMEQANQQRANIMQSLKEAAGGTGVAGLAQALAGQGILQSRQAAIDIGKQEQAARQMGLAGEQWVQEAEIGQRATMLGMGMGEMAGARAGYQQSVANIQSAYGMQAQMKASEAQMYSQQHSATVGAIAGVGGALLAGAGAASMTVPAFLGFTSDRDLKKNIKKMGKSDSGLNIYSFEWKDKKMGEGVYQGVMSDDLPKKIRDKAVSTGEDGYDVVDYSVLDVEFKRIG